MGLGCFFFFYLAHKNFTPFVAFDLHRVSQLNELSVPLIAVLTLDLAHIRDHPASSVTHRALLTLALRYPGSPALRALSAGQDAIRDMLSGLIRDFLG